MNRKEPVNSKRIRVINTEISEVSADVVNLHEHLIDREGPEALFMIERIKSKLNLIKGHIEDGHILKPYKSK